MKTPLFIEVTTLEGETLTVSKDSVIPTCNEDQPNVTFIDLQLFRDGQPHNVRNLMIYYLYEDFREWWTSN